ncbi:MAG: phosphoribosylamine--glycine ligase, partial [Pseudomonadota bacterium]
MRVFLVGSGGREHALAWAIAASPHCEKLVVAPGNPGIAAEPKVTCIPVAAEATAELVAAAVAERADLVVCGPEVALCAGLGDAMRAAGLAFFGPSRAAAEIEGSKAFAKRLMYQAGVPTA